MLNVNNTQQKLHNADINMREKSNSSHITNQNEYPSTQPSLSTLSSSAKNIMNVVSNTTKQLHDNIPPRYIPYQQRLDIVKNSLTASLSKDHPEVNVGESTLNEMVNDVANKLNIRPLAESDLNASSGDTYSFLTQDDKKALGEAYEQIGSTELTEKDLDSLASHLAIQRRIETAQRNGTIYEIYDPLKEQKETALENDVSKQALANIDAQVALRGSNWTNQDQRVIALNDTLEHLNNEKVNELLSKLRYTDDLYETN